ncbi:hypothetical protein B0H66DRAFT_132886 [Apodospora peruviana]|uniref:Secreted protein n=1 Tax=Apodospora peruviana TaxID=516989 RepID=A0AAE0IIZ9_9PEZI|nr:hypothetical protein B0H66DRAFT_132886 [Apodospora peruviana]
MRRVSRSLIISLAHWFWRAEASRSPVNGWFVLAVVAQLSNISPHTSPHLVSLLDSRLVNYVSFFFFSGRRFRFAAWKIRRGSPTLGGRGCVG